MKKNFVVGGILILSAISTICYAITIGGEPPEKFINNLKTCTVSKTTRNKNTIEEYIIKGKLPNGRCEVYMSSYINFENKDTYDAAISMMQRFAQATDKEQAQNIPIPTQEELIQKAKADKDVSVCKFSQKERLALYEAYQKHDGQNPPAEIKDGNVKISFSTDKMSSYDKLLFKYANGPCTTIDKSNQNKGKKYACEYADTTCYITIYSDGLSTMKCTDDNNVNMGAYINKVKEHAKAGKCTLL